jgi:PEP-CTERM motif
MNEIFQKLSWLALLSGLSLSSSAVALTMFDVTIDTSAVKGKNGQLAFDFTRNDPLFNTLDILTFSTDSALGVPITEGGLVEGDLILQANPAPFTRINGGSFFNELVLTPTPFGKSVTFSVSLSENHTPGEISDEFALFLLDSSGLPLFTTSDPSGADALFTIDITGVAGGELSVFAPTKLTSPTSLQITVPGGPMPEPATLFLFVIGVVGLAIRRLGCA